MSLEKRIKRHIIGRAHEMYAITLPRYERLCADEIHSLSDTVSDTDVLNGGVFFSGRLSDLYLANLHVRTAGRVLMRLVRFKATNFTQLESHIRKFPWELYLSRGALPRTRVTARRSRLYHTQAVAEHLQKGISARWSGIGAKMTSAKDQTLFIRLQDDQVTVSLDSSGPPLYRRGLKTHKAHAPIRETIAAAILQVAGFRPDLPLIDPMCGAGTFSLEAALMVKNMPPGLFRSFSFMQWPAFKPRQWEHLKKIAGQGIKRLAAPVIWASDSDAQTCDRLDQSVRRFDLDDAVTVSRQNFFSLTPEHIQSTGPPGVIVLNPPYGQRLKPGGNAREHYTEIAKKLKKDFKGWQAAVLVPEAGLARSLGLPLKPLPMDHGGLQLTLLAGRL